MMKITGLSHVKWENLHNWWLTKYVFAPLYLSDIFIYLYIFIDGVQILNHYKNGFDKVQREREREYK